MFRRAYLHESFDDLKRKNFMLPVRWHARPVDDGWRPIPRSPQVTAVGVWFRERVID